MDAEEQKEDPINDIVQKNQLNYLRFKEFLVEMCLMTEQQASQDCHENQLAFDLWEIIAPKVDREVHMSVANTESLADIEQDYLDKVKDKMITLNDLKTVLMAILRFNDGKRFMDAAEAPMPQSEGETGFRKPDDPTNRFMLRYEELGSLRLHFEPFYLTRLQLIGVKIENQKAMKAAERHQEQIDKAKPKLTKNSEELAMRHRYKQVKGVAQ